MNNTYLITGSTGFIGSCITRELVRRKNKVCVITRNKKLNWRLNDISSNISVYECDLLNKSLDKIVDKIRPNIIFHLASYGSLPYEDNLNKIIDINIKGTINLINAVKNNKFDLFVNTGSSSEYGIKNKKMKEDTSIPNPINDYGIAKTAATMFCQKEAVRNNLPIITLRLFSPYGFFEAKNRLFPTIILNALKNKEIYLSSPKNVRDFIFIKDVITAYINTTKINITPGEIFNIGTGKQHSVLEVLNLILQLTNSTSKITWNKAKNQIRQIEPKFWKADISKAKNYLHWEPEYSLKTGLVETIDWFKKYQKFYA